MPIWDRLMYAYNAWKEYGQQPEPSRDDRLSYYHDAWAYWAGDWTQYPAVSQQRQTQPRLYENTQLLWRHARATIRLYEQTVYMGPLSTNGEPLADGTLGAIPIDPQVQGTGADARNEMLTKACSELWAMWNMQRYKSFRPKVSSILGDSLTELVDDVDHGKTFPRTIWPGYVTDLEIDDAGNVKAYAIEYMVCIPQSKAFGKQVQGETYRFRKEVDGEAFRWFKNDMPSAYPEEGILRPVEPNPYGFVPAVWDRFELGWGDRGIGALDATWKSVKEMNSTLCQAIDYQRKQFAAPVVVSGRISGRGGDRTFVAPRPAPTDDPWADAQENAQRLDLLEVSAEGGGVSSILFDLGQTVALLEFQRDNIYAENPEGQFGQKLREMSQLTGPGAERALSDIVGMVKGFRDSIDPGTVALHQMSIGIIGQHLRDGDYKPEVITSRHEAFRNFNLDSWKLGQLDMVIADRPVIRESDREKAERLVLVETLTTDWAREQAGMPIEVIEAENLKKEQAAADMMAAMSVAGGAGNQETGPSGPTAPTGPTAPGRTGPTGPRR